MQKEDKQIATLYQTEYNKLFQAAYHRTHNIEIAQDLVHNTFLLGLENQQKLLAHPKPEAWLMVTLCNLIQNEARRHSTNEISFDELLPSPVIEPPTRLYELLPTFLSERERHILIWRLEEQLDYKDIAERLGISLAACRSCVSRAIAKCKAHMEDFTNG